MSETPVSDLSRYFSADGTELFPYEVFDDGSWHWHKQVQTSRPGVLVDEGLLPLIEALWTRGLATQFSCQGGEHSSSHPHIVFDNLDDALTFLHRTANVLSGQLNRYFNLRGTDALRLHVMTPMDGVVRGSVGFPTEALLDVTSVWQTLPTSP